MASMYERIMELPLFKGLGAAQISSFLEKTHLDFKNYKANEIILSRGEIIRSVMLLLSGSVEFSLKIEGHEIYIGQKYAAGNALCVERLFGMNTGNPFEIVALADSTVISFSKERYANLLVNDGIFLINYLNYLSYRAQKSIDVPARITARGFTGFLARGIALISDKKAEEIYVKASIEALSSYTGLSIHSIMEDLSSLHVRDIVDYSDDTIVITDRGALLAYCEMNVGPKQ